MKLLVSFRKSRIFLRPLTRLVVALPLLASNLQEMTVYSKNMVVIGKVKDIEIEPKEMKISYLVMELEKQVTKDLFDKMIVLRHGKGKVAPTFIENIGKDAIILKQPMSELKGAIESL
jgi:sporulation protein YlmC with PRC-barrel domain